MNEQVRSAIQDSDLILIGIGEEFSPKLPDFSGPVSLTPYFHSLSYAAIPDEHPVIQAYQQLSRLVQRKSCFVVTLNTDDLVFRSGFDPQQIVAPCGSMSKLQCDSHITEAGPIWQRMADQIRQIRSTDSRLTNPLPDNGRTCAQDSCCSKSAKEYDPSWLAEQLLHLNARQAKQLLDSCSLCPTCQKPLSFHTIETDGYLESGYLPQWERYKKWLSCTLNKKLCVLELGVGFSFPQIIRWPFTRTAFYNKKATFIRVHSRFPQLEAELSDKGISVGQSPVSFFAPEANTAL